MPNISRLLLLSAFLSSVAAEAIAINPTDKAAEDDKSTWGKFSFSE